MVRSRGLLLSVTVYVGLLAMPTITVLAQTFTADILGTVRDTSGAVVPNAKVTLTQVSTGVTFNASTDSSGDYIFAELQPGRYRLVVSKEGFKTNTVSDIELLVGQRSRTDVALALGAITQTVEVSAGGTEMLETLTSSIGQVINEKAITELPLNGRNFIQLATLSPGVFSVATCTNSFSCSLVFTGGGGPGGSTIAAMGLRESNVSYLIDGIETRSARWGNASIKPSPDAIQEFKMETSNFEADSGRSSVITNITLKSGSNSVHGSAYEFLRNSALDANNFFLNEAGKPRPPFRQNNFGGAVGGPIVRDKLFFFGAYEGFRSQKGIALNGLYPSAAQLAGNLADDSAGTGIFPTNSAFCQANAGSSKCLNVINPFTGQPFPGNMIPTGMLDATAQKWLPYIRQPNVAVTPNQPTVPPFNFISEPNETISDNQFHARIDYNIRNKDRLFGSASYDDRPHTLPGLAINANKIFPWRGQVYAGNWVHTFSPTTVNEFSFGYSHSHNSLVGDTSFGPNIAQDVIGLKNVNPYPITFSVPGAGIAGFSCIGSSFAAQDSTDGTFHFNDNFSWVKGRHTFKFGGAYHHEKYSFLCDCGNNNSGFGGQFTGAGLGDFLLGIPFSQFAPYGQAILDSRADYFAQYFQDDFRIRPNLTLNLGIRYETQQWPRDVNGREEAYIPSAGKVLAVFRNEIRNGLAKTPHKEIGPRVGFSYSPSFVKNTTIRGSFGIFYATDNWNEIGSFAAFGPDFIVDRAPTSNPTTPTLFLSQAYAPVTLGVSNLPPGTGIFGFDDNNTAPYVQQWNFNVQHTFRSNWLLDVAYVGSTGQHLFLRQDVNAASIDPTGTIPVSQRRPNKQYDFILTSYTGGWSSFNGLLTKVEHRVTSNGYLLASFTWDRALDLGNCCNYQGINRDIKIRNKGPGDGALPLALSVSYVYNLPFGRGKPFLSAGSGLAEQLISGWSVNGISTFSAGPYATPFLGFDYANLGTFSNFQQVPNKLGPALPAKQTISQYWLPTAYALPGCSSSPGVFTPCSTAVHIDGDAQRNSLEGPGISNWDISLVKDTRFNERLLLQFRSEFFNTFNHPQFGLPNGTLNSGIFGVITSLRHDPREIQFGLKLLW
jgi:hypothetical protein